MRLRLAPLLILLLPLAEIATFVAVGREIGVLATLGLIVLSGIVGAVLLRVQGIGLLNRIRSETQAGRSPARELVHGAMIVIAGVLLMIPGFLTDILGLLLFIPAVRDIGWRLVASRIVMRTDGFGFRTGPGGARPPGGRTIDLDAEEYRRDGAGASPWKPIDRS